MGRSKTKMEIRICKNCNDEFEIKPYKKNIFCGKKCSQIFTKSKNKEWLKKRDKTNIDKYGAKSPLESVVVRETYKNNFKQKYGVTNPFQVKEFKEKSTQTILSKYGTKFATQNKEVGNKISKTLKGKAKDRINFVDIKWEKLLAYEEISGLSPLFSKQELIDNKLSTQFNNKFKFQCKKCDSITEVSLDNGYLPSCGCSNYKGYSIIEEEITKFIKFTIDTEVLLNRRDILPNRLEIDIFLPELNLAIEVNGIYWHSESLGKYRDYHLYKTEKCNDKGIELVHVLDFEWLYKKPIIQSILLNKIKKVSSRIFARKCQIQEIKNTKVVREFLNKNHIQGYTHTSVNLGLFYNNELVSLMTFGKNRFKKNSKEWEMVRFCNKLNTNIVGGGSKLFKFFIENFNLEQYPIISFADIRFFNGKIYKKLGFDFNYNTKPSYIYWKNNIILNRMSCQKHKLPKLLEKFDINKTEYENMRENGWRRVWDCGNMKFTFNYK
jgi:hypothetical protein